MPPRLPCRSSLGTCSLCPESFPRVPLPRGHGVETGKPTISLSLPLCVFSPWVISSGEEGREGIILQLKNRLFNITLAILSKARRIKTEANVTVRIDETSYVYIPVRHKPTGWEVMTVTEVSAVTARGQGTKRGPHSADLAGAGRLPQRLEGGCPFV